MAQQTFDVNENEAARKCEELIKQGYRIVDRIPYEQGWVAIGGLGQSDCGVDKKCKIIAEYELFTYLTGLGYDIKQSVNEKIRPEMTVFVNDFSFLTFAETGEHANCFTGTWDTRYPQAVGLKVVMIAQKNILDSRFSGKVLLDCVIRDTNGQKYFINSGTLLLKPRYDDHNE